MIDERKFLEDGIKELELSYTNEMLDELLLYKKMVLEKNKHMNLTAINDDKDFIIKHIFDSLSVLKYIQIEENAKIIDIGTGAGFPAMPMKILRKDLNFLLVDSQRKKLVFIDDCILDLKLKKIKTIHERAEDLAVKNNYANSYDFAISRAVAYMDKLAIWCLPFVKVDGYGIFMKNIDVEDELADSKTMIKDLSSKTEEVIKIKLPQSDIEHSIVKILKKEQISTRKLENIIELSKKKKKKAKK